MPNFIIALIVVFGGLWLIRKFAKTTPNQAAGLTRKLAGGGLIALSGILALRGLSTYAVPLFAVGLGLLGQSSVFPNGFPWSKKSPGQKSRVATSILAMEDDHDTAGCGHVVSGPFKGTSLEAMSSTDLQSLYDYCARAFDQSISLLEAWLERNKPEWRETWTGTQHAKQASPAPCHAMRRCPCLGLRPERPARISRMPTAA